MATQANYKALFLKSALKDGVLTFGTYTLKSGRQSPYFFNSSLLHSGSLLLPTAKAYATILSSAPFTTGSISTPQPTFDILFGPAYKGIPLAAATLTVLTTINPAFEQVSYAYNRKEAKDHGEGGITVGAPLKGKRVLVVDDVITAGTALREAISIIEAQGGTVVGVILLLDREERVRGENGKNDGDSEGSLSAVEAARRDLKVPVEAIVGLKDLIEVLGSGALVPEKEVERLKEYRDKYGVGKDVGSHA